jgi:hypothetical protein
MLMFLYVLSDGPLPISGQSIPSQLELAPMSLPVWKKWFVAAVVMAGAFSAVSVSSLLAQKPEAKPGEKPAATEKKSVRRLPAHYADLVEKAQREKIYAVQEKYDAQISPLAEQIKNLQKQRDAEIEAVLNADQKSKLEKARADAKAKAAERAAANKAAASASATTEKPATAPAAKPVSATAKPAGK